MLGAQMAHWSFFFNSEASLVEGERILDNGPAATPRFTTSDLAQGYSPIDQYLMGFRSPEEVAPSFYVAGLSSALAQSHPLRGYSFDGDRIDVAVEDIIQSEGRRIPDSSVAQRRFRFAFILVAKGSTPPAADIAQLETYRAQFEPFFNKAASNHATAEATLRRSLKLSLFPAAGIPEGGSTTASLTVETAPSTALAVDLQTLIGTAKLPSTVTIPAGARSVTFTLSGVRSGVEEVTAVPRDGSYETAFARVQVASPATLLLEAISGDRQVVTAAGTIASPVVVRLTDVNRLPYSGVRSQALSMWRRLGGGSYCDNRRQRSGHRRMDTRGRRRFFTNIGLLCGLAQPYDHCGPRDTCSDRSGEWGIAPERFGCGVFRTITGANLGGGSTAVAGAQWRKR